MVWISNIIQIIFAGSTTSTPLVNCGAHNASSCQECPTLMGKYHGRNFCNGECSWNDNQCVAQTSNSTWTNTVWYYLILRFCRPFSVCRLWRPQSHKMQWVYTRMGEKLPPILVQWGMFLFFQQLCWSKRLTWLITSWYKSLRLQDVFLSFPMPSLNESEVSVYTTKD